MPPLFIKGYSVDMTGLVSWCRECVVGSRVAPSRRRAGGCAACRRSTRWRRRRSPRQTSSPFSATTPRSRCRSCPSPSTGTSTGPVSSHCTYLLLHPFNGPLSGTTQVSQYQKGKTNLDFTGARDSKWHWHQLGHMQVCTSLQTDNHASTPPLLTYVHIHILFQQQPRAHIK